MFVYQARFRHMLFSSITTLSVSKKMRQRNEQSKYYFQQTISQAAASFYIHFMNFYLIIYLITFPLLVALCYLSPLLKNEDEQKLIKVSNITLLFNSISVLLFVLLIFDIINSSHVIFLCLMLLMVIASTISIVASIRIRNKSTIQYCTLTANIIIGYLSSIYSIMYISGLMYSYEI